MKRFAFAAAAALAALATAPAARASITLDGIKDGSYNATPVATDPTGDLATPGPADWNGVAWTDQDALYSTVDGGNLYIFARLPNYDTANSHGTFGLAIDVKNTAAGGTSDAWGNAITFAQSKLPDFLIRGDVPADGGWTEIRSWNGTDWNTGGGTNWGGLSGGGENGTQIAWEAGNGVEFAIPLTTLGVADGDVVNVQFFGTQAGASKGAYDSLLSDDQSTGWDDATTLAKSAPISIAVPEPTALGVLGMAGLAMLRRRRHA